MTKGFIRDSDRLIEAIGEFCSFSDSHDQLHSIVSEILHDIKQNGDDALLERTLLYDKASLTASDLPVTEAELRDARNQLSVSEENSIVDAIKNITLFHEKSIPENWDTVNLHGAKVGELYYPIRRVGIYVPGGNVPLISTVIMTVTLARVAKVEEIVVTTPPDSSGMIAPQMLATLDILGVKEIYKVGGAQAIAAMSYGTETIPAVDKIFGPGNSFVNEAKRQVYGTVGIDLLPGPSEVMVIADSTANASFIAAALLAQAEHGSGKEKIFLLFFDENQYQEILAEINTQLETLNHKEAIKKVLSIGFLAVHLPSLERMAEVANFVAPEHLELQVDDSNVDYLINNITTAGAFLVGHMTATSLGDFLAGPSHVLPTGRSSRFSSGLRLHDFLRRSSFIKYDKDSARKAESALKVFAEMEKLDGHGKSFSIRL